MRRRTASLISLLSIVASTCGAHASSDRGSSVSPEATQPAGEATRDITVWLLSGNAKTSVARGAQMGAEEMTRTASLLGRRFVLREIAMSARQPSPESVAEIRRTRPPVFVLLDLPDEAACGASKQLRDARQIVLVDPRIRSAACPILPLAIRLSQPRRDAILREAAPGQRNLLVDEWHPTLQRFGAEELNQRYQRWAHNGMDGEAWAGWFATKVAVEAALRLEHLSRQVLVGADAPTFDGHKGVPLRFNSSGVLDQPIYVIEPSDTGVGRVLKEIS